jgi:hypothetical protein
MKARLIFILVLACLVAAQLASIAGPSSWFDGR